MITLENVSALELYYLTKVYGINNERDLLLKNDIKNYKQVKELVDKYSWLKETLISSYLNKVLVNLEKYDDKEPNILITPGYIDERFLLTDSLVRGDNLILNNPTNWNGGKFVELNNYTIGEIKFMLSHTDSKGNNSLTEIRQVCNNNIYKIFDSVKMYEEQVIRQAGEEDIIRVGNLFKLHKKAKMEIVEDNLKDIILYLIYSAREELIWGRLTDTQKRLLISTVISNSEGAKIIRSNLVDIISNYTTLGELDSGITNSKVLNRFIKR